jgi:hypothetical protein
MSIQEQTKLALANLACGFPAAQMLSAEHDGQRITAELAALDSLACAFAHLSLSTDALAGATPDRLRSLAEALSKRVTYLLEPVSPIEVDAEQSVVQLRSNPPQRGEGQSSYYELLVRRGGEISLRRYAKDKGQPRQVVPANVTREVLLRLVGDFSAVLA